MLIELTKGNEVTITLKDITDLLQVQHSKAMVKVKKLSQEPNFGEISKMDTINLNGLKVETYVLNKKQAIAVGAKLNNSLLMKLIDKLEELESLSKPKNVLDLVMLTANEMKSLQVTQDKHSETLDYLVNKAPIVYNQIKYLEDLRKKKTFSLVGYENKDNYSKTIRKLTKLFKDKFQIARYADLPKDKYNDAIKWVNDIQLVDLI